MSLGGDVAPSGAASTETTSLTYGLNLREGADEWLGGVPRTDQSADVVFPVCDSPREGWGGWQRKPPFHSVPCVCRL